MRCTNKTFIKLSMVHHISMFQWNWIRFAYQHNIAPVIKALPSTRMFGVLVDRKVKSFSSLGRRLLTVCCYVNSGPFLCSFSFMKFETSNWFAMHLLRMLVESIAIAIRNVHAHQTSVNASPQLPYRLRTFFGLYALHNNETNS